MAANDKPTPKQLTLLRRLADQTGQTFAQPLTRKAASGEIVRLLHQPRSSRQERREDREVVRGWRRGDGAQMRDGEIEGYGSSAHWRGHSA